MSKDRNWILLYNDIPTSSIKPPKPDLTYLSNTTQVYVQISSLHDDRCGRTLHSLMTNAEFPERVNIGVVQQNDPETIDCIQSYCNMMTGLEYNDKDKSKWAKLDLDNKEINNEIPIYRSDLSLHIGKNINIKKNAKDKDKGFLPYSIRVGNSKYNNICPYFDQITTIKLTTQQAKGPNLARSLQQTMIPLNKNEFCLQIDAHSFADKNWDTQLLREWGTADNEMAILSTYVGSPENLGKNVGGAHEVPHLCTAHFNGDFPFNDRASAARYLDRPILAPLWAAGLSFSKCHSEIVVPYDIKLVQIWTGEEYGRGARLWTNGYDIYTPTKPIIAHDYSPGKNQKHWHQNATEYSKSRARLMTIMRMEGSDQSDKAFDNILDKFDIGKKRTLDQYIEFCGVDIVHKKNIFDWCVDYPWVTYHWTQSDVEKIRNSVRDEYRKYFDDNDDVLTVQKKQNVENVEEQNAKQKEKELLEHAEMSKLLHNMIEKDEDGNLIQSMDYNFMYYHGIQVPHNMEELKEDIKHEVDHITHGTAMGIFEHILVLILVIAILLLVIFLIYRGFEMTIRRAMTQFCGDRKDV